MKHKQRKKSNSSVAILLAAYNGEEWILEQLNSILFQDNINVHIFISVDLSDDSTLNICKKLEANNNMVTVLPYGEYFGEAAKNFYRLIKDVDFSNFDYISFSDQDDIWLPNKLFHAINVLKDNYLEAYSSDVIAFWEDGKEKLLKKSFPQKKFDYYFESPGPGCTYLLTKDSAEIFKFFLINNYNEVNAISSHDWFIYAFFRSRNMSWLIDKNALMFYRQHNSNQVGINHGFTAYLKRLKMIKNGWYSSEVKKIVNATSLDVNNSFDLSKWFLIRNFFQLRRRKRNAYALLLMILLRFFK